MKMVSKKACRRWTKAGMTVCTSRFVASTISALCCFSALGLSGSCAHLFCRQFLLGKACTATARGALEIPRVGVRAEGGFVDLDKLWSHQAIQERSLQFGRRRPAAQRKSHDCITFR